MSTCDYVHEKILNPLNIKVKHWERDPQGIFSGGYGVHLTPREMAKIGQVLLEGGTFKGQRIFSRQKDMRNWIKQMQSSQAGDVKSTSFPQYFFRYGFLSWIKKNGPLVKVNGREKRIEYSCAWGWGGQYICAIPDLDINVVLTTNTAKDFEEDFNGFDFIDNYVIGALTDGKGKAGCEHQSIFFSQVDPQITRPSRSNQGWTKE